MLIKLNNVINKNQINFFIVSSFFLIFLSFVLSKGFINDEEISDKIFLITSVISIEFLYLLISNNIINFNTISTKDYLILLFFFILNFIIWNIEKLSSYIDLFIFFSFHFILVFFILIFSNLKNLQNLKTKKIENLFLFVIITILFSGFFFELSYSSKKELIIIILISLLLIMISLIILKLPKWFDIIVSIAIFLVCTKVFLLSSIKDAFHYSWYLGPINSLNSNYNLLDNVVSQYGYLNILLINKISFITNLDSPYVLVFVIIIFFLIFFYLFFVKILENINLPFFILISFLCFLIFGNIGYANLSGSMLIPSSSVFRFLPSLVFILFLSKFIKNKINLKQSIIFYILLFIGLLWSFESSFFILLPIFSYLFLKIIFNKNKTNFLLFFLSNKIFSLISIIVTFIFIIFIYDKNYYLFYEHALNTSSSLSEPIINNKLTLCFLYLLFISYLILRDSYSNKLYFYNNILWFTLFVSYSTYFVIRSVDNNIINILPFILFTIFSMRTSSEHVNSLRKLTLTILVFICIVSSFFSVYTKYESFYGKLFLSKLIVVPEYLESDYKPHFTILEKIGQYDGVPLTLISGKNIHNLNNNLPSKGYGMPILPLEQFNILDLKTKQNLMNNYFKKNNKHLLLCLKSCDFYFSDNSNNHYNKIFLGENLNYEKLINFNNSETLYLLNTKF
tara:strand:- start:844 stop:2883 length:2040 start_codon:yes stop_codon:yes gene_type:complete